MLQGNVPNRQRIVEETISVLVVEEGGRRWEVGGGEEEVGKRGGRGELFLLLTNLCQYEI